MVWRQAGGAHAVGVLEQRDHQIAEHHGVGGGVDVLQQTRGHRPVADALGGLARLLTLVPDIPFIERDVHVVRALQMGLGGVDGGGHVLDEAVHIHAGGQEAGHVARAVLLEERLVVGVAGDEVHVLVGLLKNGLLPLAEGRHAMGGGAAHHQFHVRIDLAHAGGHGGGEHAVVLGGLVAELPRAVHLVAQAPHADIERLVGAVGAATFRQLGAAGHVRVLQQVQGLLQAARAQVDGLHQLVAAGGLKPFGHLVQAEFVGFGGMPGQIESTGTFLLGADAVLPAVAGHEVAARVADGGGAEFLDQVDDVLAEAVLVGGRVVGLVDAGVHATAKVLDERTEQTIVDRSDLKIVIDDETCGQMVLLGHGIPFYISACTLHT